MKISIELSGAELRLLAAVLCVAWPDFGGAAEAVSLYLILKG